MTDSMVSGYSFQLLGSAQQNMVKTLFNTSVATKIQFDKEELKAELQKHTPDALKITCCCAPNERILNTNPVLLHYMNNAERTALEENLLLFYYQLWQQYQKEYDVHQTENLNHYYLQIEHAAFLIRQIRLLNCKENQKAEENEAFWKQKYADLAFDAYRFDFNAGKTVHFSHWLSDLNTWRIYWSWTGNFLRTSLAALPDDFFNKQTTTAVASYKRNYLGYLSWMLYYTRFLIHFLTLLKHSIIGPWMSQEEKESLQKEGAWNHLKQQLKAQKLSLLNDLFWGSSNLVGFFWLVKELAPIGNLVTMVFLSTDLLFANVAANEAEAAYQNTIHLFEAEINLVQEKIDAVDNNAENQRVLFLELKRLRDAEALFKTNHTFQQKSMDADKQSAIVFLSAYAMMVAPWVTLGLEATAITTLGLAGAFVAFAANVYFTAYKAHLTIEKIKNQRTELLHQCETILNESNGSLSAANFIRYQDLLHQIEVENKNIRYQRLQFLQKVAIQSLLPFALFVAFTFASFGMGLAIIASAAVLSLVTKHLIEKQKPSAPAMTLFSQTACNALSTPLEKLHLATALA